jgi:signal transduction histidine kinase
MCHRQSAGISEGDVSKPLRALIVEDSEQDAALLVRELRRGGYDLSFERVETPDTMQAALDKNSWDVVLSDYSMPRFSAPAALALVRGLDIDLPFIIISGTIGEETAVTSLRAGAHDFLVKGSLARLLPAIEREMGEAALRREKKKMQEQLLISDRMATVGLLAAGVAHEINNPLAILVSNLELLSQQVGEPTTDKARDGPQESVASRLASLAEPLRDAREAAERVRLIARDLKVLSRSSDAVSHNPVDIRGVLESAIRMASNEVRHRARLTREYADVPPVNGNESRLGQVFLNLIVNAAHAIPEGHVENNEIKFVIRMEARGRVAVEIHDSGAGIPDDALPHIFDSFFTTKAATTGTGLGLAICRRIIAEHDGEISVQSQVGVGSVFRTLLPVASQPAAASSTEPAEVVAGRRGRILAVDDEPMLCSVIQKILGTDHDVTTITSAKEALRMVGEGARYDLILCDLMMPDMTGMDFHARLQQSAPDQATKIMFMTGGAFTEGTRAFLADARNVSIEKPFRAKTLREQVNRFIAAPHG